ncbi:hypothetical protein CBL_07027 [Carabus blaptoides fortunei]
MSLTAGGYSSPKPSNMPVDTSAAVYMLTAKQQHKQTAGGPQNPLTESWPATISVVRHGLPRCARWNHHRTLLHNYSQLRNATLSCELERSLISIYVEERSGYRRPNMRLHRWRGRLLTSSIGSWFILWPIIN